MNAIGTQVRGLEHVGSTAIPGIKAKPIIDMLLGIDELATGTTLLVGLRPLGYRYLDRQVVSEHHVYAKGASITHLLHVVEHLGPQWRRLMTFRGILRARPEVAREYEAVKVVLSRRHAADRQAYSEGKEPFIERILSESAASPHSSRLGLGD